MIKKKGATSLRIMRYLLSDTSNATAVHRSPAKDPAKFFWRKISRDYTPLYPDCTSERIAPAESDRTPCVCRYRHLAQMRSGKTRRIPGRSLPPQDKVSGSPAGFAA